MERSKFVEEFNKASDQLDKKRFHKITKKVIDANREHNKDQNNYLIVMEELGELSQETSKAGRDKLDRFGLIEEMADVALSLVKLQKMCDISTLELYKAMNVKLDRMERILNEKGVYL